MSAINQISPSASPASSAESLLAPGEIPLLNPHPQQPALSLDCPDEALELAVAPGNPASQQSQSTASASDLPQPSASQTRERTSALSHDSLPVSSALPIGTLPAQSAIATHHPVHFHTAAQAPGRPSARRRSSDPLQSPPVASSSAATVEAFQNASNARDLDPDFHWLSEDEGSRTLGLDRRIRRPAPPRSPTSGDGDTSSDDKTPQEGSESKTSRLGRHAIHHRPSGIQYRSQLEADVQERSASPRASSRILPTKQLVPLLLRLLTCPVCMRSLRDATTLSCGHTVCFSCIATPTMHKDAEPGEHRMRRTVSHQDTPTRSDSPPDSAELGRSRSGSSTRIGSWLGLGPRSNSQSSTPGSHPFVDSPSGQPRRPPVLEPIAPRRGQEEVDFTTPAAKSLCPYEDCRKKALKSETVDMPRIDVVLQKIISIIRRAAPLIYAQARHEMDADLSSISAGEEGGDTVQLPSGQIASRTSAEAGASLSRQPSASGTIPTLASESSCSSAELASPLGEEAKRTHKSQHKSQKKRRNAELSAVGLEQELEALPETLGEEIASELECQVCFNTYYEPITTHCGHTFCRACLMRSLDHSDKCPLCRSDFVGFAHYKDHPSNGAIDVVLEKVYTQLHATRISDIQREQAEAAQDVPIFVCSLAFPNMPTFLHVFEPRYRLMMRRAMDGNKLFGMVLPSRQPGGLYEYGTMLEIKSLQLLQDGRSMIETVGMYRFKVLSRGTLDGYTIGKVERIDDITEEQERALEEAALARSISGASALASESNNVHIPAQPKEQTTAELIEVCRDFIEVLRSGSAPWLLQRLNNTFGPMPESPADFSFWMAAVIPIDQYEKAKLLQITSARLRLRLLVFWINQMRTSWWWNRGCTVM
ncbi:uncharacterized protein L969DRAFT_105115 [Mixia osmundae IAM 14324]|uniref:RING-type domain-containing protein n=1 Tax=Mixia osmundae (strain CBS 9802 / IAM 14324 / JCM 22182 / KY 12970) TaxID=764103 RepID=G7DX71_MIXOS|nr:uncharacterized protein L969DRAFT_105115 [Mixia osmundae IAM 14324]KEI37317.1 hypothetical protein L969DRAFT_105115 [Mixia osmundae IAM 14324]GAA95181.1 hypothetical protein E5Q_01836 [Mixia osmundae IAM 14324]